MRCPGGDRGALSLHTNILVPERDMTMKKPGVEHEILLTEARLRVCPGSFSFLA